MAGGLVALLDDVAALAKAAAASIDDIGAAAGKASVKAAGVVVDDTAVTPRYVHGFSPNRELPIIRKIAIGSIRNKLLIILPVAMILSEFLPQALPYLLIAGGLFLCFEGAEKVYEALTGGHHEDEGATEGQSGPELEKTMVSGAIRTDLILSAEIMVISLSSVEDEPFLTRLLVLLVVAILITVLVYGVVALIVKMDDVGLALAQRESLVQSVDRSRARRSDAEGDGGAHRGRDRRDAVGRRPHPSGQRRRGRIPLAGRSPPRSRTLVRRSRARRLRRCSVLDCRDRGVRTRRARRRRDRRPDRAPDPEAEERRLRALTR